MLTDCPDPTEVANFHFLQLKTLRITKGNKSTPELSGNILAAASKYGLLFVGTEGGFKVINLESILTLDEDKENRSIVEDYAHHFVSSGTPTILSVNANGTTLAVCLKSANGVILNLYNICSYSSSDSAWQPFLSTTLSPSGTDVRDFLWNPVVESWYAVCFSDGSLQIHEVAGKTVKVVGTLQGATTAVCWSPKGKQLVAGRDNGTFTQYKPNLTEVQTVPPPRLEESPVSVTSISWIANTLFAVVYVVGDTPNLFIVSTPKNSPIAYTNYYDVCLGNNCAPNQKYLLHLEPSWGIMICASCDSIEVAVLGDMPNWVQWDLKEDGKALLPGKDGATHAIGMTVMYCAQRELIISESESYPPMPILFLLTNNGLLVSFHMINADSKAPSLVFAPLPLENASNVGNVRTAVEATPGLLKQTPSTSNQPLLSATFSIGNQAAGDHSSVALNTEVANMNAFQTFGKGESLCTLPTTKQKESSSVYGDGAHVKKLDSVTYNQVQKIRHSSLDMTSSISTAEKQNEVNSSSQNSYMTAIISEIQSFVKELQDLKQLQNLVPIIDAEEDIVSLKTYALNLHNFQKNVLETMQSISSDIYTLKNMLLESFVMVEEACSRERRRNDHSYITLLKERALDPITAKRMQKMNQHYQYLNIQMQEVSDKLDQDWINLYSNKKKSLKSNLCISSTEAIYKTIVNNQKIIHNLRKKVEFLMKKSDERKLQNTTKNTSWKRYNKRSVQEDLSKLADEFLQVKIAHPEEGEPMVTKKLSSESLTVLKTFLKQSSIITVRPTAVYSPSQSRLLSNTALSEDLSDQDHEKDISVKQINILPRGKEVAGIISSPSEAQTLEVASKYSVERTPNQSTPITPVYEPITPPDVNHVVPVNKTFSDNNAHGIFEKLPKQQIYQQPLFKAPSTVDSSVNSYAEQKINSNILSSSKSNIEASPNISYSFGGNKPLLFNQTVSEGAASIATSLFTPQALSFTSNVLKVTESVTSKPVTVTSNTVQAPAAPSFQFASSFGPKKDVSFSTPINTTAASLTKISSQLESKNTSENPPLSQPEISLASLSTSTLNLPAGESISFISPMSKTSQVSNSSLFTAPESKTLSALSGDKEQSSTLSYEKSNVGFFPQKSSNNVDQPNSSVLQKDIISENLSSTAADEHSAPSPPLNKIDFTLPKSSSGQVISGQLSDVEKSVTALPTSISPNQTPFITTQKTENSVVASSEPTKTFSNISDSKEQFSSSEISTSEFSTVPITVTSAAVSETSQSALPVTIKLTDLPKSVSTSCITSTGNVISQSDSAASKPSTPLMPVISSVTTTSVPATTLFAPNTVVSSSLTSETSTDVTAGKTESSAPSVIGAKSPPLFGQSSGEPSSFFGTGVTFNQPSVTQSTPFGQTASVSNFPSLSGGFFSQVPNFATSAASATTTTTSSSDFNNQTSTFSFGKPAFGQTTGSFGLAKSFFGQNNATPFTQSGASSNFSLGQNQNSNNVFGQGSFFSGLGGKPSEENASKNVFELSSNVKLNTDNNNLFRNSSVTSFGAVNSGPFSSTGSFSSGGGSVAQAGFGAFQQNTSPQPAGFVSTPSFGGAPAFGSPPAFGASPAFGSGSPLSSSIFSQQQVSSNFSNFANANSPTFGSLASQSPGFGSSSPVSGFGSPQGTGFGSAPVFGGSSFGGQSSGFGSPGSPPSNSSAFTQWRN